MPDTSQTPETPQPPSDLTRKDRRLLRTIVLLLGLAVILALLLAALAFGNSTYVLVGVIVLLPYLIFVSAPFWLARTSEDSVPPKNVPQSETVDKP